MQTLRKKTSPCKYRNDPGRFFGDGVQFKAKLIGILEVGEARGDRMCQEALQDLKMAIRAAGEHKQRITIHVTIDGLRLRDEKTGDSLYHHPVHKISFIAQDMTDSRAFGYIFGSPDSGHRFFGIKTDKAASQVVLAMRDLFQVVFELKKKEIELARQQIQSKSIHDHLLASLSSIKSAAGQNDLSGAGSSLSMLGAGLGGSSTSGGASGGAQSIAAMSRLGVNLDAKGGAAAKEMSPESVADLVDLEQELSSIQRGITQMERITPSEPVQPQAAAASATAAAAAGLKSGNDEDPFGDSFTNFPSYNLLPPPESGRSRHKPAKPPGELTTSTTTQPPPVAGAGVAVSVSSLLSPVATASGSPATLQPEDDDSWLHELDPQHDAFESSKAGVLGIGLGGAGASLQMAPLAPSESTSTPTQQLSESSQLADVELVAASSAAPPPTASGGGNAGAPTTSAAVVNITEALSAVASSLEPAQSVAKSVKSDAFTDLDPLGTGRTRPYVDKKYFFQELKNPPKKVLKDLSAGGGGSAGGVGQSDSAAASYDRAAAAVVDEFLSKEGLFDDTITGMAGLGGGAADASGASERQFQQQQQSLQQLPTLQQPHALNVTNSNNNNNNNNNATDPLVTSSGNGDPVMLPRDTDPFSPTRKKSDPFQEGDIFAKLDPFDFEFAAKSEALVSTRLSPPAATTTTTTQPPTTSAPVLAAAAPLPPPPPPMKADVFNGPLQVSLPPEGGGTATPPPMPPINVPWKADISRLERQVTDIPSGTSSGVVLMGNGCAVRSRPIGSMAPSSASGGSSSGSSHLPGSVFKQQTADVISSISNKKMPHLFGQARFSKRDSNSINMRRLQESDSLSETETAPEPPPRPDSATHAEPPPLPPKKQFNDIVIRPRVSATTATSASATSRYEAFGTSSSSSSSKAAASQKAPASDVPPIPLPLRRVGRSDGAYPGPGRPRKPGHTEDDYLAPIGAASTAGGATSSASGGDVPPLLPPPTQTSTRTRTLRQQSLTQSQPPAQSQSQSQSKALDIYENKSEILQQQKQQQQQEQTTAKTGGDGAGGVALPDITLSQLLTLGIDELATKLNVPSSKLSTMTLVELTTYLSEFVAEFNARPSAPAASTGATAGGQRAVPPAPTTSTSPGPAEKASIFKVNFDAQATFVAKFDDSFGEETKATGSAAGSGDAEAFVANFEQYIEPPVVPQLAKTTASTTAVSAAAVGHGGRTPAVPPADRYAVFREIIDQELQQQQQGVDLMGDLTPPEATSTSAGAESAAKGKDETSARFEANFDDDDFLAASAPAASVPAGPPPKIIDTKITEVVAQAKDRYAALRDIILVENLFEQSAGVAEPKTAVVAGQEQDLMHEFPEFGDEFNEDQDLKQIMDGGGGSVAAVDRAGLVDSRGFPAEPSSSALTIDDDDDDDDEDDDDGAAESSLDSNDKDTQRGPRGLRAPRLQQDQYEQLSTSTQQLDTATDKGDAASVHSAHLPHVKLDGQFLTVGGGSTAATISGNVSLCTSKDDLEIDALMQRAISNLSLDSRERISPANSANATLCSTAPTIMAPRLEESATSLLGAQSQFNDMSTSPIPLQKSPVPAAQTIKSPLLAQLSAVADLIETASIKLPTDSGASSAVNGGNLMWTHTERDAKPWQLEPSSNVYGASRNKHSTKKYLSNTTSQNDTAESPCSSDPRDDGWSKSAGRGGRWPKKERQQTSSSSRDLSPWDDELPGDYPKPKRIGGVPQVAPPPHEHSERHAYYMRHARRLNSCDEDYDYEDAFSQRREPRKGKQAITRSRDNFDLDSPGWYHHGPQHSWSPQDIEQSRARSFERSAYERSTYGPPLYDKRGVALPQPPAPLVPAGGSSYDRRSGYDKRKYYRDYARPNYDFDTYGESPPPPLHERYRDRERERERERDRELKLVGRRADYDGTYDEGRGAHKTRGDYFYEQQQQQRERKSFDRESVESFESATRRRRSFGSGDVYGSLESRDDFREARHIGVVGGLEKTRSLRKGMKLRATGDIDYEQDSETDFHQQRPPIDALRSLQRPSQLAPGAGGGVGGMQPRMRKSSGSSPWDGDGECPVPTFPEPGQKSWKRPSSAAESERRHVESRRAAALVLGQTPSGSDGEKERRYRKKQRQRGKESAVSAAVPSSGRYSGVGGGGPRDNYDYIAYGDDDDIDEDDGDYVDEEEYDEPPPPTDEDKFERLNRRRHDVHQRMLESERRQHALGKVSKGGSALGGYKSGASVTAALSASATSASSMTAKKYHGTVRSSEYVFDEFGEQAATRSATSHSGSAGGGGVGHAHSALAGGGSTAGSGGSGSGVGLGVGVGAGNKFNFDAGFESDFNQCSPPPAPVGTASSCNSTPAPTASVTTTPATKSSFRFSNDFSERSSERLQPFAQNSTSASSLQQFEMDAGISPSSVSQHPSTPPPPLPATASATITQKLRFDDNVKISQFDDAAAFEDDFSTAQFDFEKDDRWQADAGPTSAVATTVSGAARKHNLRNSKLQQRQELIKKSESINIFAKKAEDPFEDDEFFKAPGDNGSSGTGNGNGNGNGNGTGTASENNSASASGNGNGNNFQWDDDSNFAKFDENM